MEDILKAAIKRSEWGRLFLLPYRLRFALSYYIRPLRLIFSWLFTSKEHANLTYDLDSLNVKYLAALVSSVTGVKHEEIFGYLNEIRTDRSLEAHIRNAVIKGPARGISDARARYGRRIGWYAFVRATKPKTVVETGVEKGLGTCVIAAALMKNTEEGFPGKTFGTDINPAAGYLIGERYGPFAEVLCGDSIESLEKLPGPIDLFINDSDHSAEYEAREYEAVASKLSPKAIILGDNAHVTDKLLVFAEKTGRSFVFFQERPSGHWYPGAGIGIAFTRK
jgi:hypothetical protein